MSPKICVKSGLITPPQIPPSPIHYDNSQDSFADLALPICEILQVIQNKPFFKRPAPLKYDIRSRNPTLYCKFHKERGQLTENFRALRFLIDKLLKEGKIQGLIAKKVREKVVVHAATIAKGKGVEHVYLASEDVNDIGSRGTVNFGN